jgi:capping protein beta
MASEDAASAAALQLMRRLPPEQVVNNLGTVLNVRPDLTEELLSRVDQPLQVATDEVSGRDFLLCDYNRDADSYRHAPSAGAARNARIGAAGALWR